MVFICLWLSYGKHQADNAPVCLIDWSLLLVFCALNPRVLVSDVAFLVSGWAKWFWDPCCYRFLVIIPLYEPTAKAAVNMEIKKKNMLLDLEGNCYLPVQCQNQRISKLRSSCVMHRNISSMSSIYVCSFCKMLLCLLDSTVLEWHFFIKK